MNINLATVGRWAVIVIVAVLALLVLTFILNGCGVAS